MSKQDDMEFTEEEIDLISSIATERITLVMSKGQLSILELTLLDFGIHSDEFCIGEMQPGVWILYLDACEWHVVLQKEGGSGVHCLFAWTQDACECFLREVLGPETAEKAIPVFRKRMSTIGYGMETERIKEIILEAIREVQEERG